MIRQATIADLPQLSSLFDAYRVFYRKTSDIKSANQFLSERLTNQDSIIYVQDVDGQLVGFTQLYPLFSSTRMKRVYLLNDLFVNPESRGKGHSIQLINRAKQLAQDEGACGVMLETEKTNQIGNNLYPKTGFKINGASNFYEWNVPNDAAPLTQQNSMNT